MPLVVQRGLRSWLLTIGVVVSIALLIALLNAGLIACASLEVNQLRSTSTPSAHQVKKLSPISTTSTQVQHCREVQTGPQGILLNAVAAKQATNCFWQAFQHCRAATLSFTSSGVDAAMIRTFTLENKNNQCSISETAQNVMGPNPPSVARTYACMGLAQQSDGLHFASCGEDGDVFVPTGVTQ